MIHNIMVGEKNIFFYRDWPMRLAKDIAWMTTEESKCGSPGSNNGAWRVEYCL